MGVVTSLGQGKDDTWAALTAGKSGIHRIERFPTEGLRTTIAGTIDSVDVEPFCAPVLSERLATLAAEEAVGQSGLAQEDFPGALFIAVPPVEMEWPQREALAEASGQTGDVTYKDLLTAAATGRFKPWHDLFIFGTVADRVADRFGTKGSPISLSTACSSGATAIQLGVEAIRRGETDAALCIGTDGSVNPESLIRFSLLSALSTQNENPEGASKPFSKNRDGFVMGEGGAALVLENADSAKARGAKILGYVLGCGEKGDGFHRTRSSPDGMPAITAIRQALDDAGLTPDEIDYINAHGTSTPENDKMEAMSCTAVFGERMAQPSDLLEQVDDRPYAHRRGRGRGGDVAPDARHRPHSADDQLSGAGSRDPARRGAERRPGCERELRALELLRLRRPEHLPRLRGRAQGSLSHDPGSGDRRRLRASAPPSCGPWWRPATTSTSPTAPRAMPRRLSPPSWCRRMPAAPSRPMKSTCPTRRLWTPSARASKARVFFGLVHNAGQPYDALAAMMQQDKAEAAMQVNFWSFTRIAKALMRGMIRAKQGRIVAIGSVAALQGNPGNAAYAASKGALISYCRTLSVETAKRGVTVNVIAPGFIDTDMMAPYAAYRDNMEKQIPAGRFAKPEEIAGLAAFLLCRARRLHHRRSAAHRRWADLDARRASVDTTSSRGSGADPVHFQDEALSSRRRPGSITTTLNQFGAVSGYGFPPPRE